MSYEHDAGDRMEKALKGILVFVVVGLITLSAAVYFLSQSMSVLTQPDASSEQPAKH